MALVEGAGDVFAVKGGVDGELVVVRLVVVCFGEVICVAGEDLFGDDTDGAVDWACPGVCSVVDAWVKVFDDVVDYFGGRARIVVADVGCQLFVCPDVGWCEKRTFVGVVARHDRYVLGIGGMCPE